MMFMGSVRYLLLATTTAVLLAPAARAADMAYPLPPPPPVHEFSGWYLRGDIGMSNQRVKSLFNVLYATADTVTNISKGFDSGVTYGVGAGYQFNNWFRMDVTGEYRGKTNFRGLDVYTPEPNSGTGVGADDYYASKSEWLFLSNFYVDLGTWWCLTPFIGAGIGASRNTIHDFRDVNVPTQGVAYGVDASKWNFAWALYAGVGYEVTPNVTLELAYRYVDLGDAASGDLRTYNGISTINNPMEIRGITSHDVRLGMRWKFDAFVPPPPYAPPLIRKG
jgi:opacity protein-like surface antigen